MSWANLPGCDQFDLSKLPAVAQWGHMQVQTFYTEHNTSATINSEDEIPVLTSCIHTSMDAGTGYISAACLLALTLMQLSTSSL